MHGAPAATVAAAVTRSRQHSSHRMEVVQLLPAAVLPYFKPDNFTTHYSVLLAAAAAAVLHFLLNRQHHDSRRHR